MSTRGPGTELPTVASLQKRGSAGEERVPRARRGWGAEGSASDRPDLTGLQELLEALDTLPPECVPDAIGKLEVAKARLWARLVTAPVGNGRGQGEDRMLDIEEAAARTGMSRAWLYRHKSNLPFAKRIGRKVLFSKAGLTRWLATRGR